MIRSKKESKTLFIMMQRLTGNNQIKQKRAGGYLIKMKEFFTMKL